MKDIITISNSPIARWSVSEHYICTCSHPRYFNRIILLCVSPQHFPCILLPSQFYQVAHHPWGRGDSALLHQGYHSVFTLNTAY